MGAITDFFNRQIKILHEQKLLKKNSDIIDSTFQELESDLKSLLRTKSSSTEAISIFKKHADSDDLHTVIDEYPEFMDMNTEMCRHLQHSHRLKGIMVSATEALDPEDVIDFAQYIIHNKTLIKAIALTRDGGNQLVLNALSNMAEKCPTEDKLKLFSMLDTPDFLGTLYVDEYPAKVSRHLISSFKGIEEDTALTMLQHSNSWKNMPKTQSLRDNLIHYDGQHLVPALGYSNSAPSTTHEID